MSDLPNPTSAEKQHWFEKQKKFDISPITNSPCSLESVEWRECLKEGDYMPDRDMKKCDQQRRCFYECIKAWRAKQVPLKPGQPGAQARAPGMVPELCSGLTDKLRSCMEMQMFETLKCHREMNLLRECMAKVDPEVHGVLEEFKQEQLRKEREEDDILGIPQMSMAEQRSWTRLWQDKPQHAQDDYGKK